MAERAGFFDFKGKAAEKAERERLEAEATVRSAVEKAIRNEQVIRSFYEDRMNVASIQSGLFEDNTTRVFGNNTTTIEFKAKFKLTRALTSMKMNEIIALKYTHLLYNYDLLTLKEYHGVVWSIVYDDGNCEKQLDVMELKRAYCEDNGIKNNLDAVRHVLSRWSITTSEAGIGFLLSRFVRVERANPDHHIVKEFRNVLLGGNGWLSEQTLSSSPLSVEQSPYGLFIGEMETGQRLWFDGEGSLITIAPPGSGKTQCNVFPNLLNFRGSTVVLDVKGECFSETSAWRRKNCGPVYKFNPLNPAESARYNPLAFIENDPDTLWEDCRLLADLLIVPENRQDASWENRGRDVVAGVIAWLVRTQAPENRRMGRIVDIVSKIDWDQFVNEAKYVMDVPPLSRLGNALAVMPERQLEGVLDAARRHLAIWEGARVERVTSACDWTPEVLRDGSNSTVYICIPPNEIESYAPLLRVIFAQHLRQLMKKLPERGAQQPILFMLDELPRLGQMRPVEEALEVGRQYGIRLWMFAQSLGQLERAYTNAEGMVGNCGIRVYMNPSAHDGTTKRLSEELGQVESIIDNSRQAMAEPSDLAGPKYANHQIVFSRNSYPAKLKKVFAHSDPTFRSRLEENASLAGKA